MNFTKEKNNSQKNQNLIIGISGASGIAYGIKVLELLKNSPIATHLVITQSGLLTLSYETKLKLSDLKKMADHFYPVNNLGACIASGSYETMGMIVAPCSIKTMSEIATGVTSNLLSRSADVILKERRKLVLMVRETPFHLGHIETMLRLTQMGAIIAPPVPSFYTEPQNIDDMVTQTVCRNLDLLGIHTDQIKRWDPKAAK